MHPCAHVWVPQPRKPLNVMIWLYAFSGVNPYVGSVPSEIRGTHSYFNLSTMWHFCAFVGSDIAVS